MKKVTLIEFNSINLLFKNNAERTVIRNMIINNKLKHWLRWGSCYFYTSSKITALRLSMKYKIPYQTIKGM